MDGGRPGGWRIAVGARGAALEGPVAPHRPPVAPRRGSTLAQDRGHGARAPVGPRAVAPPGPGPGTSISRKEIRFLSTCREGVRALFLVIPAGMPLRRARSPADPGPYRRETPRDQPSIMPANDAVPSAGSSTAVAPSAAIKAAPGAGEPLRRFAVPARGRPRALAGDACAPACEGGPAVSRCPPPAAAGSGPTGRVPSDGPAVEP